MIHHKQLEHTFFIGLYSTAEKRGQYIRVLSGQQVMYIEHFILTSAKIQNLMKSQMIHSACHCCFKFPEL